KHFCIITPYDAQRAAIERQLKTEDLPHHMVFNVDSFQGNEADYVLISVVRTTQPGFLKSLNRMNVMLTRARAGMIIVTNRDFLRSDGGRRTLLGQLALHWESENWRNIWIDWRAVADTSAHLPGSLGPLPPSGPGSNEAVRTVTELGDAAQFPPLPMRIIPSAENESAVWGKRLFPARPLDTACISQSDVRVVQYIPRSPVPPTRMTQPAVGGSWAKRTKVEQTYADLPRRFSSLYEFPPLE
ncbi:AAA domain-containing protein, partial [Mycena sp. CBHHK59/15]